jgi:hypothetical protein
MRTIRLATGYYQTIYCGEIIALTKKASRWECQPGRGQPWRTGFKARQQAYAAACHFIDERRGSPHTMPDLLGEVRAMVGGVL